MIRFACRCSQVLELPDDMAGLSIQCKKCGLLLDIPALSDLHAIENDGTYRLDSRPKPKRDEHLKELTTVYFPGRHLSDGSEIDLRGPVQPAKPSPAPDSSTPLPPEHPKYDPETGELIIPVDVNQPVSPVHYKDLPTAKRVINYTAAPDAGAPRVLSLGVFSHLFEPTNLIVLLVVFLIHIALVMSTLVSGFIYMTIVAPFLLVFILVGHYAMLIEEMGPSERDELPRPLRNVHPYDDFIAPFLHMAAALLLCYWPSLVIMFANLIAYANAKPFPFPYTHDLHLAIFLAGSLFFPATILILCTSGNLVNLRPDRILGTIRTIGVRYLLIWLLWMVAISMCVTGQLATVVNWISLFQTGGTRPLIAEPYLAYPMLAGGVYLLHAFGWVLGLEYRRSYQVYPWILQYHVRTPETVQAPTIHPKLTAAEEAAQQRAAKRAKSQVR